MRGMPRRKKTSKEVFDLLVVGLGPAGVACQLQAIRDGLRVIGASDEPVGGLVRAARRLDNLPGLPAISGPALADRMKRQLAAAGAEIIRVTVRKLERRGKFFRAELSSGRKIVSRAVVLATGTRPNEWEFDQKRVHRDARTLPKNLRGRQVLVVGGGEAAFDTALTCCGRGAGVTVMVRADRPRAHQRLLAEAVSAGVKIVTGTQITRLDRSGAGFDARAGRRRLRADILVACIGRRTRDELMLQIASGPDEHSGIPEGVFLAGDLVRGNDRYVATAMGDGQCAALEALDFLRRE